MPEAFEAFSASDGRHGERACYSTGNVHLDAPYLTGLNAIIGVRRFFRDPIGTLRRFQRQYGRVVMLGQFLARGPRERKFIVAIGPEYNKAVLGNPGAFRTTGQTIRGPSRSSLRRLRFGLTAMNGPQHRQQRQLIAPYFSKKAIEGYHGEMVETAGEILGQWPTGEAVDMSRLAKNLMLRISARILFGRESPATMEHFGEMIHQLIDWSMSPLLQVFPIRFPGSPMTRLCNHADRLESMLLEIIRRRRKEPIGERKPDMLDRLIGARDLDGGMISDGDLAGQANILFGASYETQAASMMWTMLLVAQHPKVQRQLLDEVQSVVGPREPSIEDLDNMPYLASVLNESLRLMPSVPYSLRRADVDIDLAGVPAHRFDWVLLSHFMTHRLPELYPEPDRFIPDRWASIEPNQYEYFPFSAGPRWCIGKPLATMTLKLCMAMVLQRWQLQMQPGARVDQFVRVTMRPKHGLMMVLQPHLRVCRAEPICGNLLEMVDWTGDGKFAAGNSTTQRMAA
jgi:cytochrome P450